MKVRWSSIAWEAGFLLGSVAMLAGLLVLLGGV